MKHTLFQEETDPCKKIRGIFQALDPTPISFSLSNNNDVTVSIYNPLPATKEVLTTLNFNHCISRLAYQANLCHFQVTAANIDAFTNQFIREYGFLPHGNKSHATYCLSPYNK